MDHILTCIRNSIYYIIKKNNLKIVGEWWFGSDFSDLSRSLITTSKSKNSEDYKLLFNKFFYKHIDKLQSVLDKEKLSSDLQIILKNKIMKFDNHPSYVKDIVFIDGITRVGKSALLPIITVFKNQKFLNFVIHWNTFCPLTL